MIDLEYTEEFEKWWSTLTIAQQESVDFSIQLLLEAGIGLRRPHADAVRGSKFANMRELRCQHQGTPLRVLYAFDPRRSAVLLLGGDKTGNARWYEEMLPKADAIYTAYLDELRSEGLIE